METKEKYNIQTEDKKNMKNEYLCAGRRSRIVIA
jgi:hypothetical protein